MSVVALDLFAGSGWGVACKALGIDEHGVDNMQEVVETRSKNGMSTIFRDVWEGLDGRAFVPPHHIQIASPPCQTFSAAGSKSGNGALADVLRLIDEGVYLRPLELETVAAERGLDPKTALVLTPLAYAVNHWPRIIAWEQVKSVLPVWEACAEVLRTAGYSVWTGVLQAEQYGVPQARERAFLLALSHGDVTPPPPTHSRYHRRSPERLDEGVLPWVSMAQALGWGEGDQVRSAQSIRGGDRAVREASMPAFTVTQTTSRVARLPVAAVEGDTSWAQRRPSPTVVGSFRPDVVAAPGYRKPGDPPRQKTPGSILVTPEEAAILQSFPEGFEFAGAKSKQFLQIGNAVPPLLAYRVLEHLLALYRSA